MAGSVVGIDISSRRILAAEIDGRNTSRPTLARVAEAPLADGIANDSEVIDIPAVAAALRHLWSNGRFGSRRVILGVGNQRVLVRDHTVTELPSAQLRQALPYQVNDLLPVPVNETILDFYPIERVEGTTPPQMRGLLVAALKERVEASVAALTEAGLKVVGVDLAAFGIVRALNAGGMIEGTQTIITVGSRTTHIVVVKDGVPQFVRIVPVGGENVTDALVGKHGLSREDAEALKHRIGFQYGNDPQYASATEAMFEAYASVFSAIRSTNTYYQTNYSGAEIDGLIFLGAESRLPGLGDVVAEQSGRPVSVGNALAGVRLARSLNEESLVSVEADLAAPIGLALGGG